MTKGEVDDLLFIHTNRCVMKRGGDCNCGLTELLYYLVYQVPVSADDFSDPLEAQ